MRAYLFQLLLGFLIVFGNGCNGEDGDITGVYRLTSLSSSNCLDPVENLNFDFSGDGGCTDFGGIEICGEGTISINADMTFLVSLTLTSDGDSFTESFGGEYTYDGETLTICDGADCGVATVSGNKISLTFQDGDEGCSLTYNGQKD